MLMAIGLGHAGTGGGCYYRSVGYVVPYVVLAPTLIATT